MEIMVAVKSLGSGRDARIVQIGAVGFDFGHPMEPHELLQRDLLMFDMVVDTDYGDPGAYVANTVIEDAVLDIWARDRAAAIEAISLCRRRGLPVEALQAFVNWAKRNIGKRAHVWALRRGELNNLGYGLEICGIQKSWLPEQEIDIRGLCYLAEVPSVDVDLPDVSRAGLIPGYAPHDAAAQATFVQYVWRAFAADRRPSAVKKRNDILVSGHIPAIPDVNQEKQPRRVFGVSRASNRA